MLEKYKHIIWDWNGTLLNDVSLCVDIINGILSKRQLKILSQKDYKDIFTFPVKEYYRRVGLNFDIYPFEILGIEWMNAYESRKNETYLYEGVKEILSYLKEIGIEQSILSAYPHDTLVEIVKMLELDSFFTFISGHGNIYAGSKIETGKELIKKIGLNKNEVVLIGDTLHDYEVADEIGAECILIANGHQSKERLLTSNVVVLDLIADLRNI